MTTSRRSTSRPSAARRAAVSGAAGAVLLTAGAVAAGSVSAAPTDAPGQTRTTEVSGTGVHRFADAVVHQEATPENGFVQRSTDVVELRGGLVGTLLYHVTSVIDPGAGTLTNTGQQWFSGRVLGSEPVVLHDDRFEFVVQLADGATVGRVFLRRSADAPQDAIHACDLDIVGTGRNESGDATFTYTGVCVRARP